jgi:putative flippase GtrA
VVQLKNYVLIGASAFIIEYAIFYVLNELTGVELFIAQSISFLAGLTVSFLGSRLVTFRAKPGGEHALKSSTQAISFLSLGLFNLVMSNLVIYVLTQKVLLDPLLAKVIVMGLIVVWNYLIFNMIIFRVVKK